MFRCHYCGEISNDPPEPCPLCKKEFCRKHQAPEKHTCPGRFSARETTKEISGHSGNNSAGDPGRADGNPDSARPRVPAGETKKRSTALKWFTVVSVLLLIASPSVLVLHKEVIGFFCGLLGLAGCSAAYLLYAVRSWQTRRHVLAVVMIAFPLFASSLFLGHVPVDRVNVLGFLGLRFIASILAAAVLVPAMASVKTTAEMHILNTPPPVPETPARYLLPVSGILLMTLFGLIAGASLYSGTSQNLAISSGQGSPLIPGSFTGILPGTIGGLTSPPQTVIVAKSVPEKYRYLATNRSAYRFTYYLRDTEGAITIDMYQGVYRNISDDFWFHEPLPDRYQAWSQSPEYENPVQKAYLGQLVEEIRSRSPDPGDQARIAISLVQNIPYDPENANGISGCPQCRMPYVVLYENKGICGSKSTLLAYLLKELGFDVAILFFETENHEAVGIRTIPPYDYRNTGYAYVETIRPALITDSMAIQSVPVVSKIGSGTEILKNLSSDYNQARGKIPW